MRLSGFKERARVCVCANKVYFFSFENSLRQNKSARVGSLKPLVRDQIRGAYNGRSCGDKGLRAEVFLVVFEFLFSYFDEGRKKNAAGKGL